MELIPPQPGKTSASVLTLTDPGTALVESPDASGRQTYVLYRKGQATPLDFGPKVTMPVLFSLSASGRFINNAEVIAGINGSLYNGARGFRFDPRTGEARLLEPVPPDTLVWGLGIKGFEVERYRNVR